MPTRRAVLGLVGSASAVLAGCAGGGGPPPETDVVVGPDSRLVFEPETLTVSVGDTVTWYFDSPGHNVCGVPGDHDAVRTPEGAEPFASYDGSPNTVNPRGETYEHTFETRGDYRYVCVPHAAKMVGTIRVE